MAAGVTLRLPLGHGLHPGDRFAGAAGLPPGLVAVGDRVAITDDLGPVGECMVVAVTPGGELDRVTLGAVL
jgi:hypothetical protein